MIAYSQIDGTKAILNSAAADCLQKNRINGEDKDLIDETIVSDKQLNTLGFKIDTSNKSDKCSYFQVIPTNEEDSFRYPIGFSVSEGALSKFANPTSTDKGSIRSCEQWAGVNCKQDESLKSLVAWKNSIADAKKACEANYSNWLTEKNTIPIKYRRWNPSADKGCPTRPPADGSTSYMADPTCTTNGCNRTVYGLDGEFVGFEEKDYLRAEIEKYGEACQEWEAQMKSIGYTNNPKDQPAQLEECREKKYWFYKGVDLKTKERFDAQLCIDNLAKEKSNAGKRTVEGCGDQVYYFCNNRTLNSEKDYKECSCDVDRYDRAQKGINGEFTTSEQGAQGCGTFWICNREIIDSEGTYNERCPATPNRGGGGGGSLREEDNGDNSSGTNDNSRGSSRGAIRR